MVDTVQIPVWRLDEAVTFFRQLWEALAVVGWHAAMTGSVIVRGESSKDLDIILYPRDTSMSRRCEAQQALREVGLILFLDFEDVKRLRTTHSDPRRRTTTDEKVVEVWKWSGKRVDIIWWPSLD